MHQIASAVGDDAFDRLVGSLKDTRKHGSLRFWHEELLAQAGVKTAGVAAFLELFKQAEWRKTGRAKDALTTAATTYWAPLLREHGFKKHGKRVFARVTDEGVFQSIWLQLSAFGGKDFAVNYASLLIALLQEGGSTTFRRLPRWWNAKTHERADESTKEVCEKTISVAFPWFQSISTVAGLAKELSSLTAEANAHTFFELACCNAAAGDVAAAHAPLQEAIRLFRQSYDEKPERDWALRERLHAERLLAALTDGSSATALSNWRLQSMVNLKLDKL